MKRRLRLSQGAPLLVYLYGPPAAGKLTIAEKVRALTGFRLFHNGGPRRTEQGRSPP